MTIEIGVILPTSTPDPSQPILGDVRESARFAEQIGLDSIWSTDHLIASAPILDGTIVLAAAAGATERITLGFGVMLLALRPVAWAAKQISSLQQVSGNRLVLGIGTGNPAHGDIAWRAAGVPYEDRGRRTDEALRVLPGLVGGERTDLGNGLEVTLAPGSPMPPVMIAGNGARALRRAADYGDSWAAMGISPGEVASSLVTLGELAALRGRPRPGATVVGPVIDADPAKAAGQLAAYADAGTERVVLAPTGPDWRQDYEFAAAVRAALPTTA
jgi:alkanesulfonate monooxygenase SsuD/methylene tetrahydromethanopterin reductase-like flavin-dependent oxidoreductase (luciferase family)